MSVYSELRRDELCKLKVKDFKHTRKGVWHLKVSGKGGKNRYLPLHPGTHSLIHEYLWRGRARRRRQRRVVPADPQQHPSQPPMPLITKRTLSRCRSGWATQTSQPRASAIIAARARKTARVQGAY